MKTYKVIRTCFHNGVYYQSGQTVTFPDSATPPRHFEDIHGQVSVQAQPDESKKKKA
jgi:hypothetical protein